MTIAEKRARLHDLIDTVDEEQLTTIQNKIEDYINQSSNSTQPSNKSHKMELMKQAANDPLFLADMKEVSDDFDHWEDAAFLAELKNRVDDYESGKVKGIPWEEVKLKARADLRAKHQ